MIHAKHSYQHNGWQFELADADALNQPLDTQTNQAQALSDHSLLRFCLDLPPRWLGVFLVEYPDTDRYSSEHNNDLGNIAADLSYSLHIALLNEQQKNLEERLQKEMQINRDLRELSVNQGKKIKAFMQQLKTKHLDIHENRKQEELVSKSVPQQMSTADENKSVFTKQILKEMEYSRKMALLGELAFGVAHQIRNPLNNFLGAIHLIKDSETSDEERKELLDSLTERVETINRMIGEFIHYTRIRELSQTPEDVNTVLKNSLHNFKDFIDLPDVELKISFNRQLPKINLDLYLMNQVFHNIIKNALEAMNYKGQITISIQKLTIKHGPKPRLEFVEILFQDTGMGIPKEDIKKVLFPFYSNKNDGMGLGLSIVKHVVRAHGGAVRIKSELGQFTVVTIYLPIR